MRVAYRLNRERFPSSGAILYMLKSCDDETKIKEEMFKLAAKLSDVLINQ